MCRFARIPFCQYYDTAHILAVVPASNRVSELMVLILIIAVTVLLILLYIEVAYTNITNSKV